MPRTFPWRSESADRQCSLLAVRLLLWAVAVSGCGVWRRRELTISKVIPDIFRELKFSGIDGLSTRNKWCKEIRLYTRRRRELSEVGLHKEESDL